MQVRSARDALMRMVIGYRMSACVTVAAELGVADLLAERRLTSAQLAAETGAYEPALRRLLRALVAMELLEDVDGRFALTPVGEELRAGRLRGMARYFGSEQTLRVWGDLRHSIMTGERAFDHVYGMRNWEYRRQHPESAALFDEAMSSMTGGLTAGLVAAYDFSPFGVVVDVGGGDGTLLAAILEANPAVRGVLFDQPDVVERAQPKLRAAGLDGRCQTVGGSFLAAVPEGGDAYVMKSIIHDWDDRESLEILKVCRAAMRPDARLLVIERVLPEVIGPADLDAVLGDLNMMTGPGGVERTEGEFRQLLAGGGFGLVRVVPTSTAMSVLEAVPAP